MPPPPSLADDLGRAARKAENLAGHILAIANDSDPIAARQLRRIGNLVLNDVSALEQVRSSLEGRQ
jgi:hypothetical protein